MSFRTIPGGPDAPLRLIVVGAGGIGRAWLRTIADTDGVELAGIVDLDPAVARVAAADLGPVDVPIGPTPSTSPAPPAPTHWST